MATSLERKESDFSVADKGQVQHVEGVEQQPALDTIREDDDQVGYNAFKEAQALGVEIVSEISNAEAE